MQWSQLQSKVHVLVHQSGVGPKTTTKWKETHKVNAELPHVFLKHKNEKTRMEEKKGNREVEKRANSCTEREGGSDGGRVQTVVVGCEGAYKPNGTLMVNGGLR